MLNKFLLAIFVLLLPGIVYSFGRKTYFLGRSAGLDETVYTMPSWPAATTGDVSLIGAITLGYHHSYNADDIACYLFGGSILNFSGSRVRNRASTDILADYFGLPADYCSCVEFTPRIVDVSVVFDKWLSLDCLYDGLYAAVHIPIVVSAWDLQLHEIIHNAGTAFYPAGYMAPIRVNRVSNNPAEKLLGDDVEDVLQGSHVYGDMNQPLQYGKIFDRQNTTRVADLSFIIGWDGLRWRSCAGAGVYTKVVAPTGNRSRAEFLFEAMAGNGGHWELGGGAHAWHTALADIWRAGDQLMFTIDGWLTHLFSSDQRRSFDFTKNGPGSRYMLLAQMGTPANNLLVNGQAPQFQYQGRLVPAINHTTLAVTTYFNVQAQATITAYYQCGSLTGALGYDIWVRSAEQLKKRSCFPANCFAIKGDAQIYGFTQVGDNPVKLSTTQSNATIRAGQGQTNFVVGDEFENLNADNAAVATDGAAGALLQLNATDSTALAIAQSQVQSSRPPILVTDSDLNICSGLLPRAHVHTLFAHLQHTWESPCASAFLGFGGSVSISHTDVCTNGGYGRWGIWLQGGLTF